MLGGGSFEYRKKCIMQFFCSICVTCDGGIVKGIKSLIKSHFPKALLSISRKCDLWANFFSLSVGFLVINSRHFEGGEFALVE